MSSVEIGFVLSGLIAIACIAGLVFFLVRFFGRDEDRKP